MKGALLRFLTTVLALCFAPKWMLRPGARTHREVIMKIRITCCLSLMMIVGSVAGAQCNNRPLATAFVNWSQYQFDSCHTGYNPFEFVLSPTVGNLSLKWTVDGYTNSPPAVVNGVAYFGLDDGVYALNASTGALLWKYQTGDHAEPSAVDSGILYVPSGRSVYALNARTGTFLWQYATGAYVRAPTLANGLVYVRERLQSSRPGCGHGSVPVEVHNRGRCLCRGGCRRPVVFRVG